MKLQKWMTLAVLAVAVVSTVGALVLPTKGMERRKHQKIANNLVLYYGEVEVDENGHRKKYWVGKDGRVLNKKDHVRGNPNPPGPGVAAAAAATTIVDSEIYATITLAPNTSVNVGNFDWDGNTYQYSELVTGTFYYEEAPPMSVRPKNVPPGQGRKYIVQAKGRAIGALYSLYTLVSTSNAPGTQAVLTVSQDHGVGVAVRPGYTQAVLVTSINSPYNVPASP